jgi:hypothetical protein
MPTYGQNLARNYEFPLPEQQVQQAQPMQGQGQAPDLGVSPPQNLQYVRDATKGVYDKYYKLQSYVSNMWKNYGIDVTKPDFGDELAVEAHQVWQESIADLKFTMDDLQNSQKMLEKRLSLPSMRLAEGVDPTAQPFSQVAGQAFRNIGVSSTTRQVLDDYQKMFFDKNTTKEADQKLDTYIESLNSQLDQAEQSGNQALISQLSEDLNAIQGALYSSEKDKALAVSRANAQSRSGDKTDYTSLMGIWNQVKQGDYSYLEGLTDRDGNRLFSNIRYNKTNNKLVFDKATGTGKNRTVFPGSIGLDDISKGFLSIAQKSDPSFKKASYDGFKNLLSDQKSTVDEIDVEVEEDPRFEEGKTWVYDRAISAGMLPKDKAAREEAMSVLNEYAQGGALEWPEGEDWRKVDDQEIAARMLIKEIRPTKGTRFANDSRASMWIDIEGVEDPVEVDPTTTKGKKLLRDILDFNDVSYLPEGQEMTPAEKAAELIKKYKPH